MTSKALRRWQAFRLLGVLWAMWDAITRLFLGGARPIDRTILVIDLLVLLVAGGGWLQVTLRGHKVAKRTTVLHHALSRGEALLSAAPSLLTHNPEWSCSLALWEKETQGLLKSYSGQAVTAFLLESGGEPLSEYAEVANPRECARLTKRLKNLRGIMENPDVYF